MTVHLVLVLLGTLAVVVATDVNDAARVTCPTPFEAVGDRCVHIDYAVHGIWNSMNVYCQYIGGDGLVKVNDAEFFAALVQYIQNSGWEDALYWIGASDSGSEGHWLWNDGTPVRMGTPFWGTYGCYNQQYPDGETYENCAVLDGNANLYFNDFDCSDTTYSIYGICEREV